MDNGDPRPDDAAHMHPMGLFAFDPAPGLSFVLPAVVGLYVATRFGVAALVGRRPATAGRVAVGHWMPIVAVALVAAASGRPAIAVGIVYSTAVAALTLCLGVVLVTGRVARPPADGWRAWPLLVPTGLLAFVAGLRGELSVRNTIVLAVEGVVVLAVWRRDLRTPEPIGQGVVVESADELGVTPHVERRRTRFGYGVGRSVQLLLSAAVCVLSAWFAVHGIETAALAAERVSAGLWTAAFLSPLVALPLLGTAVELAQRGRAETAASASVGVALLNGCGLLPLVAAVAHLRAWLIRTPDPVRWLQPPARLPAAASAPSTGRLALVFEWVVRHVDLVARYVVDRSDLVRGWIVSHFAGPSEVARDWIVRHAAPGRLGDSVVPIPLAVWRIDGVLLVAIPALLIPVAAGRLPLTRRTGVGLLAVYAAYVFGSAVIGRDRW